MDRITVDSRTAFVLGAKIGRSDARFNAEPAKLAKPDVRIDSLTTVPNDVFEDFLKAAKKAKARGQHELKELPFAYGPGNRFHLVHPKEQCQVKTPPTPTELDGRQELRPAVRSTSTLHAKGESTRGQAPVREVLLYRSLSDAKLARRRPAHEQLPVIEHKADRPMRKLTDDLGGHSGNSTSLSRASDMIAPDLRRSLQQNVQGKHSAKMRTMYTGHTRIPTG